MIEDEYGPARLEAIDGDLHPSRQRDMQGRMDSRSRGDFKELSTTLVGQLREQLEQRDREDRERRIREEAQREAEREVEEREEDKKRREKEAWEQKVAQAEEERKDREEKRKERRQNAMMTLIGALTAAIAGATTYYGTRPAPPPVQEAKKVKEQAERAKEQAFQNAVTATEVDQEQNKKLEQLGLQAVDQVVLESDTTDYTARMLKAVSSRAAKEEEPDSLKEARVRANKIRKHREEAKRTGKYYDPFQDLPKP